MFIVTQLLQFHKKIPNFWISTNKNNEGTQKVLILGWSESILVFYSWNAARFNKLIVKLHFSTQKPALQQVTCTIASNLICLVLIKNCTFCHERVDYQLKISYCWTLVLWTEKYCLKENYMKKIAFHPGFEHGTSKIVKDSLLIYH